MQQQHAEPRGTAARLGLPVEEALPRHLHGALAQLRGGHSEGIWGVWGGSPRSFASFRAPLRLDGPRGQRVAEAESGGAGRGQKGGRRTEPSRAEPCQTRPGTAERIRSLQAGRGQRTGWHRRGPGDTGGHRGGTGGARGRAWPRSAAPTGGAWGRQHRGSGGSGAPVGGRGLRGALPEGPQRCHEPQPPGAAGPRGAARLRPRPAAAARRPPPPPPGFAPRSPGQQHGAERDGGWHRPRRRLPGGNRAPRPRPRQAGCPAAARPSLQLRHLGSPGDAGAARRRRAPRGRHRSARLWGLAPHGDGGHAAGPGGLPGAHPGGAGLAEARPRQPVHERPLRPALPPAARGPPGGLRAHRARGHPGLRRGAVPAGPDAHPDPVR